MRRERTPRKACLSGGHVHGTLMGLPSGVTVHCAVTVACASGILSCSGAKVGYKCGVDISTDWNRGHGDDVNSCEDRSTELHSEYYN